MTTYREALKYGSDRLSDYLKDKEAASLEARQLLLHFSNVNLTTFLMNLNVDIPENIKGIYYSAIDRRSNGVPIQYIEGTALFMEREFLVRENVLIPRWDSEILVKCALDKVKKGDKILELGVGSGALIVSILFETFDTFGLGIDINPEAIKLTCQNAKIHNVKDRLDLRLGSWFSPIKDNETFDLIISNPPYITSEEMKELPKEVTYEPENALWGGNDGLIPYREIIPGAMDRLKSGGWLMVEHGYLQAKAIRELMSKAGFNNIETFRDNGNRDRVCICQKL